MLDKLIKNGAVMQRSTGINLTFTLQTLQNGFSIRYNDLLLLFLDIKRKK